MLHSTHILHMNIQLKKEQFIKNIEPKKLADLLESAKDAKNLRPMVYTSMDGDDMKYVDFIRVFCYQNGAVPANPMATLGYYTSTIGHKGSKKEIIKDCYKLMLSCDELWIFSKFGFDLEKADTLSEGIVAEVLVWLMFKPLAPIKSFTWKDIGIPKYVNAKAWALTGAEASQNI